MNHFVPLVVAAFFQGLLGGFSHCIGMCGVFVVSYAGLPDKGERRGLHPERHVLFHGGRLLSLGFLGLLGGALGSLGHEWASAQGWVSLCVGVVLIGLALGFAGLVPRFQLPEPDVLGAGGGIGRRLFRQALQSRSKLKPFLIGLFVGLLPCGLTYYALIPTLTATPLLGMVIMLCFGLGTIPGLLTLGVFGNALFGGALLNPRFRLTMTRLSALLMAMMGIGFIWRGLANV